LDNLKKKLQKSKKSIKTKNTGIQGDAQNRFFVRRTSLEKTGTGKLRLIFLPMNDPVKRMGKNSADISMVCTVNNP